MHTRLNTEEAYDQYLDELSHQIDSLNSDLKKYTEGVKHRILLAQKQSMIVHYNRKVEDRNNKFGDPFLKGIHDEGSTRNHTQE